jgi:hypothetical protein
MMHQHVCNRELLYFIIKLRKTIKCLEKHNLLIFLKLERIVAKQILIKHKRWKLGCYSWMLNHSEVLIEIGLRTCFHRGGCAYVL